MTFSGFIQRLIANGQLTFENGKFEMLGLRGIILPAFTYTKIIEVMYDEHGDDIFDILFQVGQEHGQLGVDQIGKRHNMTRHEFLVRILEAGSITGLGKAELQKFDMEDGEVIIRLSHSPFPAEFSDSETLQTIDHPIDHLQRGIFHRMVSEVLGAPVSSREERCVFLGDEHCQIRVWKQAAENG